MKVKKIGIVSLSSGILGENFVSHEVKIGIERLKKYGIEVEFLPNSTKGIEFLKNNPKARAKDLIDAFKDDSIDMILCAIGGDDTYRLLPYLFENNELEMAVKQKIFLGFSDTTINHFMLNKVGIKTFYGQAFLPDICELSKISNIESRHPPNILPSNFALPLNNSNPLLGCSAIEIPIPFLLKSSLSLYQTSLG